MEYPWTSQPQVITSLEGPEQVSDIEGDCACPISAGPRETARQPFTVGSERLAQRAAGPLVAVDERYAGLLSTAPAGGLAVLNQAAQALWHFYAQPRAMDEVCDAFAAFEHAAVEDTVARLVALGLLGNASGAACMPAENPDQLVAWLQVTKQCNMRCTYCYVDKTAQAMTLDTAQQAVHAVFRSAEAHGYRAIKLKFAGGEPLLQFETVLDAYDEALRLAEESGCALQGVVLTNGTRLNAERLAALASRGLSLMISLDGIAAVNDQARVFAGGRGTFEQVVRGIDLAREAGLRPQVSVTVTAKNAPHLAETVAWLVARDLPFALNFYRENDFSAVEPVHAQEQRLIDGLLAAFSVLEAQLPRHTLLAGLADRGSLLQPHQHACGVGHNYLVIDHAGQIAKCHMAMDNTVATIRTEDILGAVRADPAGLQHMAVDDKAECASCAWKHWCASGCPLVTLRATGTIDAKSPNCNIYKAIYPKIVRLEALRLLRAAAIM